MGEVFLEGTGAPPVSNKLVSHIATLFTGSSNINSIGFPFLIVFVHELRFKPYTFGENM